MRNHLRITICSGLVLLAGLSFAPGNALGNSPGSPGTPGSPFTARAAEPACPLDADPALAFPDSRYFGSVMDIENDTAAILAYRSAAYPDHSSIIILNKTDDQWTPTAELSPPDFTSLNAGLDLDGGRLALGWTGGDVGGVSDVGVIYIYEQIDDAWTIQHELTIADAANFQHLGLTLHLAGDLLFGNAYISIDGDDPRAGAVVVFRYDGSQWVEEETLISPHHERGNSFGFDIKYINDQLFIYGEDDGFGNGYGRIYIYEHLDGEWTLVQTLEGSDPAGPDWFGFGVEVHDNVAVMPACRDEQSAGKVYIFERIGGQWTETQIIENPNPLWWQGYLLTSDFFGRGLAFDGDTIIIGGPQNWNEYADSHPGRAWIYRHDGTQWSLVAEIAPPAGQLNDLFGYTCALDDDHLLISAMRHDTTTENAGVVYTYRINDCDSNDAIDCVEICDDPALDTNNDWILDVCLTPCPWDVAPEGAADGAVGLGDLNLLLSNWGACPAPCAYDLAPEGAPDGAVGLGDLNEMLSHWGTCP